jgi:hypothetical protein
MVLHASLHLDRATQRNARQSARLAAYANLLIKLWVGREATFSVAQLDGDVH